MSAFQNLRGRPLIARIGAWRDSEQAGAVRQALMLTFAALFALAGLKFGMFLDRAFAGALGVGLEVASVAAGLALGIAVSMSGSLWVLRFGFSRGGVVSTAAAPRRRPRLTAAGMLILDAAAIWALPAVVPFRLGLVSCLYYCLPAALLVCLAAPRSRRTLRAAGAVLVVGAVLAVPLRILETYAAAELWLHGSGVSERAQAQVVVLPGFKQEPYLIDDGTLTANFDVVPEGVQSFWGAVETVTVGNADPCGPILTADGDADGTESMSCRQVAADLWQRGDSAGTVGYVLERDGVTLSVTAPGDADALRREVLAAHPASDSDLWSREDPSAFSLLERILL